MEGQIDVEIEINPEMELIELNIEGSYEKYSVNDFICLKNNITYDKILIGIIKKITQKFIEINDIKIPIITKQDSGEKIILYEVKKKEEIGESRDQITGWAFISFISC